MADDDSTEQRRQLEAELEAILQHEGPPGRRGGHGAAVGGLLLGWCQRAAHCLFTTSSPTSMVLTDWGARALRSLLLVLTERDETLPPPLREWFRVQVLPGLFGGESAIHADLTYVLLKCLLGQVSPGDGER